MSKRLNRPYSCIRTSQATQHITYTTVNYLAATVTIANNVFIDSSLSHNVGEAKTTGRHITAGGARRSRFRFSYTRRTQSA